MKTALKLVAISTLLSLAACQQGRSTSPAVRALGRYTTYVNSTLPAPRNAQSGSRGARGVFDPFAMQYNPYGQQNQNYSMYSNNGYSNVTLNNDMIANMGGYWNPIGNGSSYTYGNYVMQPQLSQELPVCQSMKDTVRNRVAQILSQVNTIPGNQVMMFLPYIRFMMGNLNKCLFRMAVQRSIPMNHMWQTEPDPMAQYMGSYLASYTVPFNTNAFSNFNFNSTSSLFQQGQPGYVTPQQAWYPQQQSGWGGGW